MKMKHLLKFCFLVFFLTFYSRSNGYIEWDSLPTLLHKAPTIARGNISIESGEIILNVEKILKGKKQDQITIYYIKWPAFEAVPPKFRDSENVLLFLTVPGSPISELEKSFGIHEVQEGEMYLFGIGDQGKWPRIYPEKTTGSEYYRHYPKLQDTASLEAIQDVVERLLKIEDSNNLNYRIELCKDYIKSKNDLLVLTTLEYARSGYLWTPPEGKDFSVPNEEIKNIKTHFINNIHDVLKSLTESKDVSLLEESIRYLEYFAPGEAFPILIKNITNDNNDIRETTRSALIQIAREENISGDFVRFNSNASLENLKDIQKQWNDWWENNKDKYMKKD